MYLTVQISKKLHKEEDGLVERQYKAFDFQSGKTYLIGKYSSKRDAMAYCYTQGMKVITKTVEPLTDEEYETALRSRKEPWE